MPVSPRIPSDLRLLPFRGSAAIASGLLTRSRLRGQGWHRLLPDVYIAADVQMDHRLWCYAAMVYARWACGSAISGLSAAALFGVDVLPLGMAPVEITVPPSIRVETRRPLVTVVRSPLLPAESVSVRGLTATSPLRTALDLGKRFPRRDAVVAVDALLQRRLITMEDLTELRRSCAGKRGDARFAAVVDLVEPLAESPRESMLRLGLMDEGLPRPEAQVEVRDTSGRLIARLDLAYRWAQVGIEYDGDHHRQRPIFRADARRANALLAAGWRIVRVTGDDIPHNIRQIADYIRDLMSRPPL